MWILKGALLSVWSFGFGTMVFLYLKLYRHMQPHTAVDIRTIWTLTTTNLWWWAALAVCLALGLVVARAWSGPIALWVGLAVTGLVPAGILTVFLLLVNKMYSARPHP